MSSAWAPPPPPPSWEPQTLLLLQAILYSQSPAASSAPRTWMETTLQGLSWVSRWAGRSRGFGSRDLPQARAPHPTGSRPHGMAFSTRNLGFHD